MAIETRRLCRLLISNEERNQVHKHVGSEDLILAHERDDAVNRPTVNACVARGLAEWQRSERYKAVLELRITKAGIEYVARDDKGAVGYLRTKSRSRKRA